VAVATPSYPPELGGLGVHVRALAAALAGEGCDTTVLTQVRAPHAHGDQTRVDGDLRVVGFPSRLGGRRFGYAPGLRRYARTHAASFDVVHAFSYHAPVALALSGATDAPMFFSPVFHAGGHSALARAAHLAYRPAAARVFRRAEGILCSSHAEREDVVRLYPFCASWATVIPIAVDPHRYDGVEPFAVDRPVVLSACRLDRYKGVDVLVRAMQTVEGATLVVTGVGPEEQPLRELVTSLGLEGRVEVLGDVSDADLRRWQRTATVVASLSTRESFGLSLAEGIVAGAAIVASDIPAHREMAQSLGASPRFVIPGATDGDVAAALLEGLSRGRPGPPTGPIRAWSDVARDTIGVYVAALQHPRGRR
jgi:glycosyltransferase involved in cell wall biosynthesis